MGRSRGAESVSFGEGMGAAAAPVQPGYTAEFGHIKRLLRVSKLQAGRAVRRGNALSAQLQQILPWINPAAGSEFPLLANPCPACSGYSCHSEISFRIMP